MRRVIRSLPGEMDGKMCYVQEKRFHFVIPYKPDTVAGDQVGAVAILHFGFIIMPPVLPSPPVYMRVVVPVTGAQSPKLIKPLIMWQVGRPVAIGTAHDQRVCAQGQGCG